MLFTWKSFNRRLREATHVKDVLSLLAQGAWHKQNGRIRPFPRDLIPSVEGLAKWLRDCPHETWIATWKRCEPLLKHSELKSIGMVPYLFQPAYLASVKQQNDPYSLPHCDSEGRQYRLPWTDPMLMQSSIRRDAETLHDRWRHDDRRGKHPLGSLVGAWQDRPKKVLPETKRETGIMPQTLRVRCDVRETGELPNWPENLGAVATPEESGWLPGFKPLPSRIVPALPLVIFDATGRPSTSRGHGAALDLRLAVELLMAIPRTDRHGKIEVSLTLREMLAWLWPNGAPSPSRYWTRLQAATRRLNSAAVIWDKGNAIWRPIRVWSEPSKPKSGNGPYRFEVRLPPGSEVGPRVHRPTLRLYGLQSAPKYRAWLGLSYLWHKHLRYNLPARGGGTRTMIHPPRLPIVKRDRRTGGILDTHGRPVTHKGGKPVKSPLHPAAVPILRPSGKPKTRRNPAMDRLPELGSDELIELTAPNANRLRGTTRRKALERSRRTLEAMGQAGDIRIERHRNGWRILPPIDLLDRFGR